jgi:hypothetical protein
MIEPLPILQGIADDEVNTLSGMSWSVLEEGWD